MPKIALSEEQKRANKVKNLTGWIDGQMHMHGLKQNEVAKELGISQSSLSTRLNPKGYKKNRRKDPFSYGDLLILFKLFDTPMEEAGRLMKL